MQSVLREKLMARVLMLSAVSQIYRSDAGRFVDAYFSWLEETEKELAPLRAPISIVLQAEKSALLSIGDGYAPSDQAGTNPRKKQRAFAAQSLGKVSGEIYARVQALDQALHELEEKLCHAVAIVSSKRPDHVRRLHADQASAGELWRLLATTPETAPMHHYFSAKLGPIDRNYLLMSILENVVKNRSEPTPRNGN